MGRSYADLLAMPLDWIQRDFDRVQQRRRAEHEQLKKAAAGATAATTAKAR